MNDAMRLVATLERELQGLILEWERFFSGDRRLPPQSERTSLERRIRQLGDGAAVRGAARFRLNQLQHRFSSYCALWERQLRQREEGRRIGAHAGRRVETVTGRAETVEGGAPAGGPRAPSNDAAPRSVKKDVAAGLYEKWKAAKGELGEPVRLSAEAFRAQLERQRAALEQRLGRRVELDVVVRDGRVKLVARDATRTERGGR